MEVWSEAGEQPSRRSTQQRRLIMQIIQAGQGHLDAGEIYRQAHQSLPGISLSTVYRNMQLLKEQGMIEEHQFDGTRRCYERMPHSSHHHLVCLGCGRILEFSCPSTEGMKTKIGKKEGFKVTDAEVRIAGYCPECQQHLLDKRTDIKQYSRERR